MNYTINGAFTIVISQTSEPTQEKSKKHRPAMTRSPVLRKIKRALNISHGGLTRAITKRDRGLLFSPDQVCLKNKCWNKSIWCRSLFAVRRSRCLGYSLYIDTSICAFSWRVPINLEVSGSALVLRTCLSGEWSHSEVHVKASEAFICKPVKPLM